MLGIANLFGYRANVNRILVLNFFPAFTPPASGGELRYFKMYDALSKRHDITLLSPTYSDASPEIITHHESFREYRVPKEELHTKIHMELDAKQIGTEVSGLACSLSAAIPNAYHQRYLELYDSADVIIHDHPFMCNYDLFLGIDSKPRIYNSYNFETKLFEQMFSGPNARDYINHIWQIERTLCEKADLILACSTEDQLGFIEAFSIPGTKVRVAPNGITPDDFAGLRASGKASKNKSARLKAFFIGSGHPPNVEAAQFILDHLVDACPAIDFVIAGKCTERLTVNAKHNLTVHGLVTEAQRVAFFTTSDIAINPLISGSGTSLKTLECLSTGMPLISTDIGVRGLGLKPDQHYFHAEHANFAMRLNQLANDSAILERVGRAGSDFVNQHYSWKTIAASVHEWMTTLLPKRWQPIVLLNDFEVGDPVGGGQARIHHLYKNLSSYTPVLLICLNDSGSIRRRYIGERFLELSLPKTEKHLKEQRRLDDGRSPVSVSDVVSSAQVESNALLVAVVEAAQKKALALVYSHPYMVRATRHKPPCFTIYESLNHERALKTRIVKGHPAYAWVIKQTEAVETEACRNADMILTVTDEEQGALLDMAKPNRPAVHTIANGVVVESDDQPLATDDVKALLSGRPLVVFIGSGHMPNVTAAEQIVLHLAPALPQLVFGIIGSVCGALTRHPIPSNVLCFDTVSDDQKRMLLSLSDIAVNPMSEGSGSNLKLAEYFAARLPTVSTKFGARGYAVTHEKELLIAELGDFASAITRLLAEPKLRQKMAGAAYTFARQHLDWRVLARRYDQLLKESTQPKQKKRILVVTYRFTDPPLGGAEQYLLRLLESVDALDQVELQVVTFDVNGISNRFHFGTEVTRNDTPITEKAFRSTQVRYFAHDKLDVSLRLNGSRELFMRWNDEQRRIARRHLKRYTEPLLLGGWSPPETHDGQTAVWTSDESDIFVRGATEIQIEGNAPKGSSLCVSANAQVIGERAVSGDFKLQFKLADANTVTLRSAGWWSGEDPRRLGLRITAIVVTIDGAQTRLKLNKDFRWFLKEHALSDYVESLIHNAEERPPAFDEIFHSMRGPISTSLDDWLTQNVVAYDAVVCHSLPFRSAVVAAAQAGKAGVPYIVIPHMHFEDDFYHWRSYYDLLQRADTVISSAQSTIEGFYSKIGARSVVMHGGLDAKEYQNIQPDAFRLRHNSLTPFVLILGRKDGPKNYQWTIEAVRALRAQGHSLEVVMIGRDEDRVKISDTFVHCMGEQPREVLLGALTASVALVHMSESESFGLVVLEAWMVKTPVVVNGQCQALAELVDNNVNGLTATNASLSATLERLLQDPKEAQLLAQAGHAKAQGYTWDAAARDFLGIIDRVVGGDLPRSSVRMLRLPSYVGNEEPTHEAEVPTQPSTQHAKDFSFLRRLQPMELLVDIGARCGDAAMAMHLSSNSYGRIISFESSARFDSVLKKVREILPTGKFEYQIARLGSSNHRSKLVTPYVDGVPQFDAASTEQLQFELPWVQQRLRNQGHNLSIKETQIEVKTFDSFELSPSFVSISVLGAELAVLKGMSRTLREARPVMLIDNNHFADVSIWLEAFGYDPYTFDAMSERLLSPRPSSSLFYLHRERHAELLAAYFDGGEVHAYV